jgi:hypothetical protein
VTSISTNLTLSLWSVINFVLYVKDELQISKRYVNVHSFLSSLFISRRKVYYLSFLCKLLDEFISNSLVGSSDEDDSFVLRHDVGGQKYSGQRRSNATYRLQTDQNLYLGAIGKTNYLITPPPKPPIRGSVMDPLGRYRRLK